MAVPCRVWLEPAANRVEPRHDAVLELGALVVDAGIDDRYPDAFAGGKPMRFTKMQCRDRILQRLGRGTGVGRGAPHHRSHGR